MRNLGMKPHDFREDKLILPSILEPKFDGMRGLFLDGQFWSLEGNRIPGMQLYREWLTYWASKKIYLDGELVIPNTDFETGCGIIRSKTLKTHAQFMVFDIPSSGNVPLVKRKKWLKTYLPSVYHLSGGKIMYVPHHVVQTQREINFWFKVHVGNGLEGVVVKNPMSSYLAGKSWDWMRIKEEKIVDARIIGFIEGTGKYRGTLGSLVMQDSDGRKFKVGGGITDSQRHSIWANRKRYRLMPTECVYQRRTNTGSYRHPRIKRFRLDRV